MKTSEIITPCYLRSQSIKLLSGSSGYSFGSVQLSLANSRHDFNPGDRTTRGPERFESEHRVHHTLHGSMILLHDSIEILRLPDDNGRLAEPVITRDRCRIGPTLIDGDFLREPLAVNGFA